MQKSVIKWIKRGSFLFGLIILVLLIYSLLNYNTLQSQIEGSLKSSIDKYGYWVVFISAFLLEVIPQPFVSALVPFANGLLLGLDFKTLFFYMFIGAISSNFFGYYLGIKYGPRISIQIVGEENYEKGLSWFKKYGKIGISILALTPLPYFPILTGIFKMKFREFIAYAIIPRTFHLIIFSYLIAYFL